MFPGYSLLRRPPYPGYCTDGLRMGGICRYVGSRHCIPCYGYFGLVVGRKERVWMGLRGDVAVAKASVARTQPGREKQEHRHAQASDGLSPSSFTVARRLPPPRASPLSPPSSSTTTVLSTGSQPAPSALAIVSHPTLLVIAGHTAPFPQYLSHLIRNHALFSFLSLSSCKATTPSSLATIVFLVVTSLLAIVLPTSSVYRSAGPLNVSCSTQSAFSRSPQEL